MESQTIFQAEATHKAKQRHLVETAKLHANLQLDAQSYTTTVASGSCAFVFLYLQCDCYLTFSDGFKLTFNGKGIVAGLGATGSMAGQASFNVDPHTLKGASGISFEAAAIGVGVAGFQVTWYKDNQYIGHGEFAGAGAQLGTPGGGWGSFS